METMLMTTIEAPDPVHGIAAIDKKLYVLRKRQSEQIYVYDTKDYKLQYTINVPGLAPSRFNDLTVCNADKCLYLSDYTAKCIHKLDTNGELCKFADVPDDPKGLSITPDGNLLVTCNPNKLVEFNLKTAEKVCEVEMQLEILWPLHAMKRKDGQYVVCHAKKGHPRSGMFITRPGTFTDGLSRVCRVASDGYYRHCFGAKEGARESDQLNFPCHLALRDDNRVIVVDNDNKRLVLLDGALEYVGTLAEKENFAEPHRVWFDGEEHPTCAQHRLYVGERGDNGSIKIFYTS